MLMQSLWHNYFVPPCSCRISRGPFFEITITQDPHQTASLKLVICHLYILTVRGASYRIKGRIYSACVQSVLIYGTETWAMKADDLRSLERTERMMVRWMCGVSLKDRKRSEDLCNLLGINCVADVVRRGRLRWFGHLERKSVDDWVSACRGLVVEGTKGRGRSRTTWEQCVRDDMKLLGLHPEWAVFRDMWRDLIWGKRLTLA